MAISSNADSLILYFYKAVARVANGTTVPRNFVEEAPNEISIQGSRDLFNNDFSSEWLESSDHYKMKDDYRDFFITAACSAFLSLCASLLLANLILNCNSGLRTSYHRLLFGLCISSMICSLNKVFAFLMVPRDLEYISLHPLGNARTCEIAGFLNFSTVGSEAFYTVSICLFSLIVVKFNKSDEYISRTIEPLLHGISILCPISVAIMVLYFESFNSNGMSCTCVEYNPPHCWGVAEGEVPAEGYKIPCGRGRRVAKKIQLFYNLPGTIMVLLAIVSIMGLVYNDVSSHESKMYQYGANAIRRSINIRNSNVIHDKDTDPYTWKGITQRFKRSSYTRFDRRNITGLRFPRSHSRAVLYKALSHSLAWLLTRVIFTVPYILLSSPGENSTPYFLTFSASLFFHLYGFCNLLIHIYPSIKGIKNTCNEEEGGYNSWFRAFIRALWPNKQGKKRKFGGEIISREKRTRRRSSVSTKKELINKVTLTKLREEMRAKSSVSGKIEAED